MTRISATKLSLEYSSLTFGTVPEVVQATVRVVLIFQASPPFGVVRVKAPWILKFASEVSEAAGSETSVTRTFTVVEIASGMVQVYEPVLGADATIPVGVGKSSFEYSSFRWAPVPVAVQVIGLTLPPAHCSPPLGLVTARATVILKGLSDRSFASGSFGSETRTLMSYAQGMSFGTVQEKAPPVGFAGAAALVSGKLA